MKKLLIPVLFSLIGLGGGVAAGVFLSAGPVETIATDADGDDGHAEDDAHGEDTGHEAPDAGGQDAPSPDSPYEYVRLNNQFIVPLVRNGSVRSLVVLSLTVEVVAGANEAVYSREPRLRDAFLRVMFSHANIGGFDGSFTTVEAMDPLRRGLREAAHQVLGNIAHDVLIVDIVRQDA